MDFGAFVNFFGAKDGLVHISQLAPRRVNKVTDVVKEGDKVKVKLLGFDERGKVRLSMKVVDQETGEDLEAKQKAGGRSRRPAARRNNRPAANTNERAAFGPPFSFRRAALSTRPARRLVRSAQRLEVLRRGEVRRQASPMRARRLRRAEAQQLHALVAHLDIHRDLRQQRHAVAVRHHLHHGGERGRAETCRRIAPRLRRAERQRLVAQAVAFLQQDQPALIDVRRR